MNIAKLNPLKNVRAGLNRFQRTVSRAALVLSALLAVTSVAQFAHASSSYILLTAPVGAENSKNLAQQLSKWRQMGLVSDAQLLANDTEDKSMYEQLGILEFHNEAARDRWQKVGKSQVGKDVIVTPVEALAHGEKTPRNSNKSIFVVAQYDVLVSKAKWKKYVDNYLVPDMNERIKEKIMGRYTSFYVDKGANRPWQSLLIMEYKNPHALEISEEVKDKISDKLVKSSKRFKKILADKHDIREKTASNQSLWVELPPPDLSHLPAYNPDRKLKGSLRIVGSELKNSVDLLAEGFTHFHPDVRTATSHIPSSEGGIAGLYTGISDVAPMGDDAKITDMMSFHNTFGYMPTEISVATGGYEKRGSLFSWAIVVNKNNPLNSLTLDQVKRLFGGERTGGWELYNNNYKYTSKHAMKRSELIRTWDQLGLKGKFKGKEIETFGYAAPGFAIAIERHLLHWSKKMNPNFREYVEEKQAVPDAAGLAVTSERPLENLETNENAIGIVALMHAKHYPNIKVLAIAESNKSKAVELTPENVANRSYPLVRDAFFYVNKAPDQPLDPIVREFMRYCLSREGQETIVRAGYYYPLSKEYLLEQRKKLD